MADGLRVSCSCLEASTPLCVGCTPRFLWFTHSDKSTSVLQDFPILESVTQERRRDETRGTRSVGVSRCQKVARARSIFEEDEKYVLAEHAVPSTRRAFVSSRQSRVCEAFSKQESYVL